MALRFVGTDIADTGGAFDYALKVITWIPR